ncbi:hypothetical protein SZ55_5027 [Pseudomonas sp. FeS53a]|nr:hypothetical protein SZ55_5027 [Pseudomonas sp. FeS53a]
MPQVDGTVGIGEGACHKDLAGLGHGAGLPDTERREVGNYKESPAFFHARRARWREGSGRIPASFARSLSGVPP